jgi:ABC-type branched-subunit amino acid transport system ATPase component
VSAEADEIGGFRVRRALRRAEVDGVAPVVVSESLTKRYGELIAVDALSFRLETGTITGFLGPNGAGKTTTLRMLLGRRPRRRRRGRPVRHEEVANEGLAS